MPYIETSYIDLKSPEDLIIRGDGRCLKRTVTNSSVVNLLLPEDVKVIDILSTEDLYFRVDLIKDVAHVAKTINDPTKENILPMLKGMFRHAQKNKFNLVTMKLITASTAPVWVYYREGRENGLVAPSLEG